MTQRVGIGVLGVLVAAAVANGQDDIVIEVRAGAHGFSGGLMRWEVPEGVKVPEPCFLEIVERGGRYLAQLETGPSKALWFQLQHASLAPGQALRLRLVPGDLGQTEYECLQTSPNPAILELRAGSVMLRYNAGTIQPPVGVEPVYARSGYIHPLMTRGGRVITNDFPLNHKHHHGVWMPWSQSEFEGHPINFWEQFREEGKVECVGTSQWSGGSIYAGFRAQHRFTDLKAAGGGQKPVLDESWDVRAYRQGEMNVIDFVSVQKCAGPSPLKLKQYRYGGFGFRGSADWEGKDGCDFLTSEGKGRIDGHATAARWCAMWGNIQGQPAGISFLCHPSNFRAPQTMRIHDTEPFFNFTPCQPGDFEITPEKPLVSRYRLIVQDKVPEAKEIEQLWQDYADPPKVELCLTKDQILDLLGRRVGGEWHVEGTWSDGSALKGRVTYEWGIAKKVIRSKTFVQGPEGEYQRYESLAFWDAEKRAMRWQSFAFDGGIATGEITGVGTRLEYTWDAKKDSPRLRQSIDLAAADSYEWHVEAEQENPAGSPRRKSASPRGTAATWSTLIRATFHRREAK